MTNTDCIQSLLLSVSLSVPLSVPLSAPLSLANQKGTFFLFVCYLLTINSLTIIPGWLMVRGKGSPTGTILGAGTGFADAAEQKQLLIITTALTNVSRLTNISLMSHKHLSYISSV